MDKMVRKAVVAAFISVFATASAFAESILVEPLNIQHFNIFGAGGDNLLAVSPAPVPANQCGGAPTDTTPVPCYEFSLLYATYLPGGTRVLHVPNPSGPLEAPINGELQVEILPLQLTDVGGGAVGSWDGVATFNNQFVANPDATTGAPHTVAKVRIPASAVPAPVIALIIGRHTDGSSESIGFFNFLKRILISSSLFGDLSDGVPLVVVFQP